MKEASVFASGPGTAEAGSPQRVAAEGPLSVKEHAAERIGGQSELW